MKKTIYLIIIVISGLFGSALVKTVDEDFYRNIIYSFASFTRQESAQSGSVTIEEILRVNSLATNGMLPIRYENMTLLSTRAEGKRLTYFYRFDSEALPGEVRRFVEDNMVQIRSVTCNDDSLYQLLSQGAELVYVYSSRIFTTGTPVSIVLENCSFLRKNESETKPDRPSNPYSGLSRIPLSLGTQ
jgi:hypothetical protein